MLFSTLFHRSYRGFSLPELVTTLAIAALLIVATAPSMRALLADRRVAALTQQVYGSLLLARSEAVKSGSTVALCHSVDGRHCDPQADSWESGWLVFRDHNGNGALDRSDQLIRVYEAQPEVVHIYWNRGRYLRFNSHGQAKEAGTFTLCEHTAGQDIARAIVVSMTGRARVAESNAHCSGV